MDERLRTAVARTLTDALPAGGHVAVALSGGRDSVALLDATLAVANLACAQVSALHVNHRLSPNAAQWAQFCRALCGERGIDCDIAEVTVERGTRISVEAAARTARYEALEKRARANGIAAVLLAHHADDQAETLLLQLARGAGPRGLAAMPAARFDRSVWWLRPWLALPRATIDEYVRVHALRHIDDESNGDVRYRRNALRKSVAPAMRDLAPGFPTTLVRAAELQADAAALLDELAELDARDTYDGATLDCAILANLDARRGANVLRWFLREQRLPAASRARLRETLSQLQRAGSDTRITIRHGSAVLSVHRGRLVVRRQTVESYCRDWSGADVVVMTHGALRLSRASGIGVAERHATSNPVTIRSGSDGERLRLPGRSRRSVADLLREAGIAHWERRAIPRIYCGDALAAVAEIGVDAAFAAAPGEPGLRFRWAPNVDGSEVSDGGQPMI
ncbi:MAG TPA: tRNA lysidine(34) synthetase TilS [Casimicrobiaceae bacterium]|nr:tRNA lysidine(34) synthetase TilS [Casimicrobiaceae bacterium]